jgi:creatinine amidohydrolase
LEKRLKSVRDAFEFSKLSWPQVNAAAAEGRVALVPAATIEDHGLHLPVDTDIVIAETISRSTAKLIPEEVVLLPCITYGYSPHHIDGPGTLTLRWDTFIDYVRQVTNCLSYHGFYKILILNAHGSNHSPLDLAARLTIIDNPDAHCGMLSWWDLRKVQEVVASFRESEWTGHACELETSLYLAIDESKVDMELARKDINPYMSSHFWADLVGQPPEGYAASVSMTEYWSTVTETGTWGDPTVATAEKGERIINAAAEELTEIVRELRARPVRPRNPRQISEVRRRNDHHHGRVPRFAT